MMAGLKKADIVNTVQTYNFDDSMQVLKNDRCLELGISSLYAFDNRSREYVVAADACADIMVHYDKNKSHMGIELVGPHDDLDNLALYDGHRYFGIRLLPGYSPVVAGENIKDIRGSIIRIDTGNLCNMLMDAIGENDEFSLQCDAVLKGMEQIYCKKINESESLQSDLSDWIMNVIINSPKKYSLYELEQASGYSARYLNKVFGRYTGYSISKFSNIIRAQRVGDYMYRCKRNMKSPDYTGIACKLGYTDQAHMIHDFEKHFGMAPLMFYRKYAILQ